MVLQIVFEKFNEIFEKGMPIDKYMKSIKVPFDSLSNKQALILSML